MLSITGLNRFYYLRDFHDMRCKYERVLMSVCHRSDKNRLPEGAEIIKVLHKYSYEQVSEIVEHEYEVIRYKTSEGELCDGYFPCEGEPEIVDMVPF